MPKYHYVVLTSAVPGRLEEFERWYDNQHIPDVLKVPGVRSARRYRLVNAITDTVTDAPWNSLAVYELEWDDPVATALELKRRAGSPAMPITDAVARRGTNIIAELVTELPPQDSGPIRSSSTAEDSPSVDISSPEFRALSGLDQLRALFPSARPPSRQWMGSTLGFDHVEIAEGRVVFGATPDERFYNPIGTVHGGFAASLLDTAAGCAVHSKLKPGQAYTTLDLQIAYHRAITSQTGPLRAEGQAIQVGERAGFGEADLRDLQGKLYASATTTCVVFNR